MSCRLGRRLFSGCWWRCWDGGGSARRGIASTLCALTLALSGCASSAARTNVLLPVPTTPGAIVTDEWHYTLDDGLTTVKGQWVHLPAAEAGELLLWIEHAEGACL